MKNFFLLFFLILTSCSGISKGVTEAILEYNPKDNRRCLITIDKMKSLKDSLNDKNIKEVKVFYIHGIGEHEPGHSLELLYNLSQKLGFNTLARNHKDIKIPNIYNDNGHSNLRVYKLKSPLYDKNLIFYEFTWSGISAKYKKILSYDNTANLESHRANVNKGIKKFINSSGSDPLIYLGKGRQEILSSTLQAMCIMLKSNWDDLKSGPAQECSEIKIKDTIQDNKHVLISHSLGSTIMIDALQKTVGDMQKRSPNDTVRKKLKSIKFDLFMLSNQLPLMQVGRDLPKVSNQYNNYCKINGKNYNDRIIETTNIYAFSDPNDILSYSLPTKFIDKYVDSRICPVPSNIYINISETKGFLGISGANPLEAHLNYDKDDRVISFIANGLSDPLIQERCSIINLD